MQKILLVLGVVSLQVVFGGFTDADLRPAHRECFEELNLTIDVLSKNINEKDWTATEGNNDFNKFSLCTFRKEHIVKDDDTIDIDNYKDLLVDKFFAKINLTFENPNQAALNMLDDCKSVQGSDAGDTIVKHYNCLVNHFKTTVV